MKSYSFSFTNSYESKHTKNKEYKVCLSEQSSNKNLSFEMENFLNIDKKYYQESLYIVDEDDELNVKFLTNFVKINWRSEAVSSTNKTSIWLSASPITILVSWLAWICISISLCLTKFILSEKRLTMWEDIYGKSIVGSVISYLVLTVNKESFLNISVGIRVKLLWILICFILAFWLTVMSLQYVSALSIWALLINFYGYKQRIFLIIWIIGIALLADPFNFQIPLNNYVIPAICLWISLVWLITGRILWEQIKEDLSLSVGTFLFNFWLMMFIPSFMIVAFSIESKTVSYSVHDLSYFILNGLVTWLAIYLFIQAIKLDKHNKYEIISFISLLFVGAFQVAYYFWTLKYKDQLSILDLDSPDSSTYSNIQSIENWEYIGIMVMVCFRFIHWFLKLIKECKQNRNKVKSNESNGILDDYKTHILPYYIIKIF